MNITCGMRLSIAGVRLSRPIRAAALVTFCFVGSAVLFAATISGTVKDPSGAVISGARIEITGGSLTPAIMLSSDGLGRFESPDLPPGKYQLRVTHDGFDPLEQTVELQGSTELQLTLEIARVQTNISVPGKAGAYANSDPVYRQLRNLGLGESFQIEDFTLVSDVATFHFQKGTLTFLSPVNGALTGAIYIGDGHFHLKPVTLLDVHELSRRIGSDSVDEDFTEVVFRFTTEARLGLLSGLKGKTANPDEVNTALKRWREKVRQRREHAVGFSEYLLEGESMDNVDADVLAAIYNTAHPPFFNAYVRGKRHKDLRYFLRARVGALPQIDSPEEVGLINVSPDGMAMDDGVWYLAHTKSEYANHRASSQEDRRLFATRRYKIETAIAKNGHLFSTATIEFEPLVAGERLLTFRLFPNLRVSRVVDEQGQDLYFVQESRKEDGSFYVILAAEPEMGKKFSITVEYAGDHVLEDAGAGGYYVRARTSWYPNLNGFGEHSLYDLTFQVPHKYKVVSVGVLQSEGVKTT